LPRVLRSVRRGIGVALDDRDLVAVTREQQGRPHAADAAADDEYVCHVPPTSPGCETRDDAAPERAGAYRCRQGLTATAATRPRSREQREHRVEGSRGLSAQLVLREVVLGALVHDEELMELDVLPSRLAFHAFPEPAVGRRQADSRRATASSTRVTAN